MARGEEIEFDDAPLRSTQKEFVGREREVAELCRGLEDARSGRGRFFLVTGEPGIGKTWLADEVARRAESSAMAVVRAGCWEGAGAPAYWPFIQVLRAALRIADPDAQSRAVSAVDSAVARDLAQLIPEMQRSVKPPAEAADHSEPNPEQARFRLFDAVATAIRNLAGHQPMMLILEDLHDADQPSLLMLRFVVRQLKNAPVLLLATYRDIEVQRSPDLSQLIGDLAREGTQLPLAALRREETAQMIEDRAGTPPSPKLVSDIHQATAGNPLFIDGLVRVLAAEGSLGKVSRLNLAAFRVPDGVREAIRRWLALVSDRPALVAAAAIGQEFELRCLQQVTQVPAAQLLEVLRNASEVGIVVPLSRGSYRFSHALIRHALSDGLNSADRARLHLAIGQALEEIHEADIDSHVAELAHHFRAAGETEKVLDYSIRSGAAAAAVFAYEVGAAHWQTALELAAEHPEHRERRAELLERLGELLWLSASGRAARPNIFLQQALNFYEELGRPEASARVRNRIAVFTAAEQVHPRYEMATSREVIESSTESGDRAAWTRDSISHIYALSAHGRLKDSFALMERASAEADRTADSLTGTAIGGAGTELLIWLCDLAEAALRLERELTKPYIAEVAPIRGGLVYWLRVFAVLSGKLPPPGTVTATDSLVEGEIAFWQGNWEQADACLIEAADQARQSPRPRRAWVYSLRVAKVRRILGRHSAAEAILRESLTISIEAPYIPFELHTRQELALVCAEMQRPEQARSHLERCREILAAGEDWRGLGGHIARAEAVVAAADRRFEAAYPQFASAVEIYRRYQMPFEEAETLHYWGRALIGAGVRGAALEKLDAASEIYRRHRAGERWLERVEVDRSHAHSGGKFAEREPRAAQTAQSPDGVGVARSGDRSAAELAGTFRKQGEYWTVSWAGPESRLKHRKGFDYLAQLLRHPDREFAAADLITGGKDGSQDSATGSAISQAQQANATIARGLGDAGAALDATAKAQYKRRLEDLRDELELAEQHNNLGRAEQVRAEIEFIQAEVAAAVGLGGRDRKSASHAERARLAVTKAIKAALNRIRDADPELGRHLSLSIQTGYFCVYRPQQPVTWQL